MLQQLGFYTYNEYCKSQLWRETRQRVLVRDGHGCLICRQPATGVHHEKYTEANLRGTTLRYLWSLCQRCHEAIEVDEKDRKVSLTEARKRLRKLCDQHSVSRKTPSRRRNNAPKQRRRYRTKEIVYGGTCRDCGQFHEVDRYQWILACPPRCPACGGMLDQGRKRDFAKTHKRCRMDGPLRADGLGN
jgi:hypothetical protein